MVEDGKKKGGPNRNVPGHDQKTNGGHLFPCQTEKGGGMYLTKRTRSLKKKKDGRDELEKQGGRWRQSIVMREKKSRRRYKRSQGKRGRVGRPETLHKNNN